MPKGTNKLTIKCSDKEYTAEVNKDLLEQIKFLIEEGSGSIAQKAPVGVWIPSKDFRKYDFSEYDNCDVLIRVPSFDYSVVEKYEGVTCDAKSYNVGFIWMADMSVQMFNSTYGTSRGFSLEHPEKPFYMMIIGTCRGEEMAEQD